MNKALLLRLHRWVALVFALPLLAVILSGLVLSFEPLVLQNAIVPGSLPVQTIEDLLARHDTQGTARALFLRPLEGTMSIGRGAGGTEIDLSSGQPAVRDGMTFSDVFGTARRLHEHLIVRAGWLVTTSTIAMLALIVLGILMGLPKLRNTIPGWHKGAGWLLLPLVILSPLTGLLLALGVTFASAPAAAPSSGPPISLREAIRVIGADHDLAGLSWIRPIGRNLMARVAEDGEMKTYVLTRDGAVPGSRNWPRLLHEGTWGGMVLPVLNFVTSVALLGLLLTGAWIWARRKLRPRPNRQRIARVA